MARYPIGRQQGLSVSVVNGEILDGISNRSTPVPTQHFRRYQAGTSALANASGVQWGDSIHLGEAHQSTTYADSGSGTEQWELFLTGRRNAVGRWVVNARTVERPQPSHIAPIVSARREQNNIFTLLLGVILGGVLVICFLASLARR